MLKAWSFWNKDKKKHVKANTFFILFFPDLSITTPRNKGMQNTISECTCPALKQMGYKSQRPLRVLLLLAKNRKLMCVLWWVSVQHILTSNFSHWCLVRHPFWHIYPPRITPAMVFELGSVVNFRVQGWWLGLVKQSTNWSVGFT